MEWLARITFAGLDILATLLVVAAGLALLAVIALFIIDKSQTENAIRHNYPVIGRFRDLFSTLGEFFRQYFFAMDREEMPFNRAERDWVERSSEGKDNTSAFGSTKNINAVETMIFVNGPFAVLDDEAEPPPAVVFGPQTAQPYEARSLINISAMSYGSLSKPAIQALSRGAKASGCWLNTGEGGLSQWHLEGGCDIVFQIGTAKYGVRDDEGRLDDRKLRDLAAKPQVKMLELKLSQGAKPGKGGILPANKVTGEIARVRQIKEGEASISPNRHREISNVEELLDHIDHLRTVSGLPVGIKAVVGSTQWLEELFAAINARGKHSAPDFMSIDSGDGGTGAAPMPLMDNVGLPIKESLLMVVDALHRHGLRARVKVIASGKLITPADVAWAYCAGADVVVSARGFMFALGCIQAMKCNRNTCPTGITTHNPNLQAGLDPADKAQRVANFVGRLSYGVGLIAHACGVTHARALERRHCRIVQADGRSLGLDEIWPQTGGP
ncbi:MAG: FMN-binding glutamate synthase family protein [Pseudomonadota bacterium]